ncbi:MULTISPECIES: hypothetical protein [Bacillaceae]|uniref:hypothetical protein n=1 Tax=Bacillaceae TaxID=186817 RepID=UPI001BDDF6F9|nr:MULTISPECIES: hypothetical protein [Bacillaceae]MDX8362754.1 hypothetical protein [Cytobacillus sp. IB215316]
MILTYITALDENCVIVTSAQESIEIPLGETLAFHHTADFRIQGKAKVVANSGTIFYT